MKRFWILVLFIVLISSLSAATRYQMKQYPYYSGLNINVFRLAGNGAPGSLAKFNFGARLGYNYTPYFAFELAGSYGKTSPSDPEASGFSAWSSAKEINAETKFINIDFALRYNFLPDLGSNPYLKIGLGNMQWQVTNEDALPTDVFNYDKKYNNLYAFAGLGLENRLSEHFSINLNYKRSLIFGETDNMLADSEAPDYVNEFGLELVYKFGHGVIEAVDLVNIEAVTFEFNSIKPTKNSLKIIEYVAEAMQKNPDLVLEVRGFTDNTGSDSVNLRMSKKRSMAVKQMLVDRGISPSRLITSAMGHRNPVATNSTPEGRALNRRVEFYELQK
ncbi:MAG: OmpA family protein [Candidatus Cloacimonetes bacterium]|nr:OmpA family protein [Candidatus Cloacimonadota bacterium]